MKPTLVKRFWAKVDKNGPIVRPDLGACWQWTGATTPEGYGKIYQGPETLTHARAHRVSWELHNGPIPEGIEVLHRCDNTGCVRESHLFLGTQSDNVLDMDTKGRRRMAKGETHGRAKLTEAQVAQIRAQCGAGAKQRDIAQSFGVARSLVGRIVLGQAWSHTFPHC